ncbi:MAG: hypothetical protein ACOYXM_09245 [Actinomycetota bacterium]
MSTDERAPRCRRSPRCGRRRLGFATIAAAVATSLVLAACGGGRGGRVDEVTDDRDAPNRGAIPTLPGGVELGELDPRAVLVGAELAFGSPLPSEQLAAEAYTQDPEVVSALARRVYVASDGRHIADVLVLVLDGGELFDESVLAGFERGVVSALGGARAEELVLAGRPALRAVSGDGERVAIGFREANVLAIVTGSVEADAVLTATRQIEARGRGEAGSGEPQTPLVAVPAEAAFVTVPTVTFELIPPPEEEVGPEPPSLSGASGAHGRYGVVAGERRTVMWVFEVDRGAYSSAEALDPAMQSLAQQRGRGTAPTPLEVGGRVVYASLNEPGSPSAQVFRHQGLVLLVEGDRSDQVDAVTTAWIAALTPTNQRL